MSELDDEFLELFGLDPDPEPEPDEGGRKEEEVQPPDAKQALDRVVNVADGGWMDNEQEDLFFEGEWWEAEWQDMPEFVQEEKGSYRKLIVHFATPEDAKAFGELIEQPLTHLTRSIWFPKADLANERGMIYIGDDDDEEDPVEAAELEEEATEE